MSDIKLKVGDKAPEFALKNQSGQEVTLASLKGKKVLLSFHPLAWTGVCEIQMRTLENKHEALSKLNTVALGVSVDAVPSKKEWADYLDLEGTDLLADFWPHGDVAKKYGIFMEAAGISGRANFLIDEKGNLEWIKIYDIPEVPDIEEVLRHLRK